MQVPRALSDHIFRTQLTEPISHDVGVGVVRGGSQIYLQSHKYMRTRQNEGYDFPCREPGSQRYTQIAIIVSRARWLEYMATEAVNMVPLSGTDGVISLSQFTYFISHQGNHM